MLQFLIIQKRPQSDSNISSEMVSFPVAPEKNPTILITLNNIPVKKNIRETKSPKGFA